MRCWLQSHYLQGIEVGGLTDFDALWVASAEVADNSFRILRVQEGNVAGAAFNAFSAADAFLFVNKYSSGAFVCG
jgi:hypothetical protein